VQPWKNGIPSICLAHAAYDLAAELRRQGWRNGATVVRARDELASALSEVEVLVISGLWTDDVLRLAPRLRLVIAPPSRPPSIAPAQTGSLP